MDAYEIATGKEIYRQRLPLIGSGFSASPVAADGKIYHRRCLKGVMYVRGASTLFAITKR